VWKRKFVHTTDSSHLLPIAANVLNRQFKPSMDKLWSADITYIRSGWIYPAAVMDLLSRKIVGWAMAPGMPAELVCSASQMALTQRNPPPGLIVHSDRGVQYASGSYRASLDRHGCRASMSRRRTKVCALKFKVSAAAWLRPTNCGFSSVSGSPIVPVKTVLALDSA
jgi:putative transposase